MREMRLHPRVPVSLPVSLRLSFPSHQDLRQVYISNLSTGGVFVRTRAPLPIGTDVVMEISVGSDAHIVMRGKVVWERLYEQGELPGEEGFGVRFTEPLDPRLDALLRG
jgi:type IV pilus assembly protein PilZ